VFIEYAKSQPIDKKIEMIKFHEFGFFAILPEVAGLKKGFDGYLRIV